MGDSMRKVALNLICSLAAFATVGLGLSVAVKASVGMGSFSALATNIAVVGQWKVGTLTATLNLACLIVYMFLTQWRYPAKYVCQILATISLGEVMNFFSYYILDHVIIDAYWQQLALSVLSIVVIAPAVIDHDFGVYRIPDGKHVFGGCRARLWDVQTQPTSGGYRLCRVGDFAQHPVFRSVDGS